jgi:pilus assembly protein Flp/PilA
VLVATSVFAEIAHTGCGHAVRRGTLKSLLDFLIHQLGVLNVKQAIIHFLKGEEGLTVVEYAIAGSLVGLAVVLAFTDLGAAVEARIREIIAAIS